MNDETKCLDFLTMINLFTEFRVKVPLFKESNDAIDSLCQMIEERIKWSDRFMRSLFCLSDVVNKQTTASLEFSIVGKKIASLIYWVNNLWTSYFKHRLELVFFCNPNNACFMQKWELMCGEWWMIEDQWYYVIVACLCTRTNLLCTSRGSIDFDALLLPHISAERNPICCSLCPVLWLWLSDYLHSFLSQLSQYPFPFSFISSFRGSIPMVKYEM